MTDIGPGDFVLCVVGCNENSPAIQAHWLCGAEIVEGRVYTVMEVVLGKDQTGADSVGLVLTDKNTHWPSAALNGSIGAWSIEHFRPLPKGNIEILRSLLKEKELEPAI